MHGYLTQAVVVNNRDNIIITLAEDAMSLEETVVVGYATQKKANLTGAVSTINVEKDINRRSTNTISNLRGCGSRACRYGEQFFRISSGSEQRFPQDSWHRYNQRRVSSRSR